MTRPRREKLKRHQRQARPKESPQGRRVRMALFAAGGIFLAARLVAALLHESGLRAWGLDVAGYLLPGWDAVIALLVPAAGMVPAVIRAAAPLFEQQAGAAMSPRRFWMLALAGSLLAAWATTWFHVAFPFLGDGSYYMTEVFRIATQPDYATALVKWTSYLTGLAVRAIAIHGPASDPTYPFRVLGGAGIFALTAGLFLLLRRERRPVVILLVSLLAGAGGTLFFFGYVELYALQYVFLCLYFVSVWTAVRHGSPIALPAALLALSIGFGGSSAIFLPSLLYLLFWNRSRRDPSWKAGRAAVAIAVLQCAAAAGMMIAFHAPASDASPVIPGDVLLPMTAGPVFGRGMFLGVFRYTVFSQAHLLDIVNVVLLNGGAAVPFLAAVGFLDRRASAPGRPLLAVNAIAAVAGLLLLLFGDSIFGLGRDWDLAAMPVVPFLFLAAAALTVLDEQGVFRLPAVLPFLVLLSLSQSVLWVRVNASEEASARRLADLVAMNEPLILPRNTYVGWEHLFKDALHRGDNAGTAEIVKRMIGTGWDQLQMYRKMLPYVTADPATDVYVRELPWLYASLLDRSARRYPPADFRHVDSTRFREFVTASLLTGIRKGRRELVRRYIDAFRPRFGSWREFPILEAYLDDALPPVRRAELSAMAVDTACTEPILLFSAGYAHVAADLPDEAIRYYQRALAAEPHAYPVVYLILAQVYERRGDIPRAISTLQQCADSCLLAPERPRVLEQIGLLRAQSAARSAARDGAATDRGPTK